MHKVKKIFILFSICFISLSSVWAQISIEPDDEFYEYVESWEIRGLVKNIPPIRPYGLNSIKNILQNVIKRGNAKDADIAIEYWQKITGKPWNLELETKADLTLKKREGHDLDFDKLFTVSPAINGDAYLYKELISIGYDFGITARTRENESPFLPNYTNSAYDARQDPASLGPLSGYIDINSAVAVGNDEIFMQAGLNRSGFGPFGDQALALNQTSYHSANLAFTVLKGNLFYAQQYSALGATDNFDGTGLKPEKFIAFHTIGYHFTPKFSIAYYETMVYGNRFDFSYFLPVPYMAAQGIGGNSDNLQMGLIFKWKPVKGFLWATDLFVDDFDVDKLVKLNLNGKNRFGLQTGFTYAPENSFCRLISFDYTAISPYTYSHWEYVNGSNTDANHLYNFQNYTNNGVHIGSTYEPNSDVFALKVSFKPLKNLHIGLGTSFMRHGNVCENDSDSEAIRYLLSPSRCYATDGSLRTNSMFYRDLLCTSGEHVNTAWNSLNFLNQETKMYVVKANLNVDYTAFQQKFGSLTLNFGYTFEYIRNKGVDSHIYPGGKVTEDPSNPGNYLIDGRSGSYSRRDTVEYFHDQWKKNLHNEVNNYITIGFTYRF